MTTPKISICIPTYNRCENISKTLLSLMRCPELKTGEAEVIIADNCSTDGTKEAIKKIIETSSNIHYYRNENNIMDRNFPFVLSKANGKYLKLCNDRFCFYPNALHIMIDSIDKYYGDNILLFYNGENNIYSGDLNTIMKIISFNITDIQTFGMYKKDFIYNEFGCNEHLFQVENFLLLNKLKKNIVLVSNHFGNVQTITNKDMTYGVFDIFYNKYLNYFKKCLEDNRIDDDCFTYLKKDLLLNFFSIYMSYYKNNNNKVLFSDEEDLKKLIYNKYKDEDYYLNYVIKYNYLSFRNMLKNNYEKLTNNKKYSI